MTAHISITETLQFLAGRLDPIIQARLEPDLGGVEWTAVLTEIDLAKGRTPRNYWRTDLQSQLRILTERLGSLGFPFDDHLRTASTLGGELRIMRNRWAHNDPLTNLDAVRTADSAARLLRVFSDVDGAEYCRHLHDQALLVYAEAKELITFKTDDSQPAPELIQDEITELHQAEREESTVPDDGEMSRGGPAGDTPTIGNGRFAFDPWTLVVAGDKSVLDELPKKDAKMQVRAVAAEIAEFEGPIHIDRLVRLTARSFELNRVGKAKFAQLRRQLKQLDLLVDDGFIWPSDIDPKTWDEFRPNDSSVNRPFTDISPVEIANAYRSIAARRPDLDDDDLDSAVLRTFGRKRKTREYAAHLKRARANTFV